jgi:NAD(P)-dependent dehydrogenase (short-subunit alcohol dehydrogenase family)
MKWTTTDIPDLSGRRAIVTGSTSGLGLVTAAELAIHGAEVTLAVRDTARGEHVATAIRARHAEAKVDVQRLDVADVGAVREFAAGWLGANSRLDLLINNAGVMAIPRAQTVDGFEMQFGTNHLGHFALTGLLLPAITATPGAHRMGRMRFSDLMGEQKYSAWGAYGQSKLANLLFMSELERRFERAGIAAFSVAAHPGYSSTNLQSTSATLNGGGFRHKFYSLGDRFMAQTAEMGALPTLYAATNASVAGGDYVGPSGLGEMRGHPKNVGMSSAARNRDDATQLWLASEELTGVRYLD